MGPVRDPIVADERPTKTSASVICWIAPIVSPVCPPSRRRINPVKRIAAPPANASPSRAARPKRHHQDDRPDQSGEQSKLQRCGVGLAGREGHAVVARRRQGAPVPEGQRSRYHCYSQEGGQGMQGRAGERAYGRTLHENSKDQRQRAERPEPAVPHDLEAPRPPAPRAEAVESVGKSVLVQCSSQGNPHRHGEERRHQRGHAEPVAKDDDRCRPEREQEPCRRPCACYAAEVEDHPPCRTPAGARRMRERRQYLRAGARGARGNRTTRNSVFRLADAAPDASLLRLQGYNRATRQTKHSGQWNELCHDRQRHWFALR